MENEFRVGGIYRSTPDASGKTYDYKIVSRTNGTAMVRGRFSETSDMVEIKKKVLVTTYLKLYDVELFFPFGQNWNTKPVVFPGTFDEPDPKKVMSIYINRHNKN